MGCIKLCGQQIPVGPKMLFHTPSCCFGVEICEDVWAPIPPSSELALNGAEIIFNLSADNEGIGKHTYLKSLISQQSARCLAGYVFSGCGFGESTQDVVFSGKAMIYENGVLLAQSERFSMKEQIIISEIGICAIYGAHDPAATQWSEEFQADYLSRVIREVFDSGEICGLSLWQLNNAHTYHRRGGCLRVKPLGENSAGVYDLYRRPKLAAQTVSELFHVLSGTCPEKRNKIGELLLKPQ